MIIPLFCMACGCRIGWGNDDELVYFLFWCDDCKEEIE